MTAQSDHFVPQMMIKRFAGPDGKLIELCKPDLQIGTRRRAPKGILFEDDLYRDNFSDFDEEHLIPIEQKFSQYYPLMADHAQPQPLCSEGGTAFIEWVAAMLVRTRPYQCLFNTLAEKMCDSIEISAFMQLFPKSFDNLFRLNQFNEYIDLLSRPQFHWKVKTFDNHELVVLTDHPVCQTNGLKTGGQVTIVPLSKNRVMFGGHQEAIEKCNCWIDELNAFLAGWAHRSVFAAERHTLEAIRSILSGENKSFESTWCRNARQPLFGFLDRLGKHTGLRDEELPDFWKDLKASYGESILPWKHELDS